MPEHLRALVVIVVLATVVFMLAQKPLCASVMDPADYRRRRNVWFAVTVIGFLAHNFWLYMLLTAVVAAIANARERNPLALYCALMFAMPPYEMELPGMGLINYVVALNHIRLLNLVILLPAAVRLMGEGTPRHRVVRWLDWLVGGFLLYRLVMQATVDNLTGDMRAIFYLVVDIWLPYYVASRSLRDMAAFRDTIGTWVLAMAVMALIGAFEGARGWLLYMSLRGPFGIPPPTFGDYLLRGDGMLRAVVSSGHSIALGYTMMVGLVLMVYLMPALRPKPLAWLGGGALLIGLISPLARGPWIATAAALAVAVSVGRGGGRRLATLVGVATLGLSVLLMSPMGDKVIDLLPFVGTVDEGNVTYRQRLFEVSMQVLWHNPVFGAFDYVLHPAMEQLRQGQGIIDIVNTYLAIALSYGLVGLFLFVSPFAFALLAVWRTQRRMAAVGAEPDRLGRALLGALCGTLLTIATVSSIGVIPNVYWLLLGMCGGYVAQRITVSQQPQQRAAAPRVRPARRPAAY